MQLPVSRQVNCSTRDVASRERWVNALSDAVAVGVVGGGGALGTPRRRPFIATYQSSLLSSLVRLRCLQRELSVAEGFLCEAQADADARIVAAVDQLQRKACAVPRVSFLSPLRRLPASSHAKKSCSSSSGSLASPHSALAPCALEQTLRQLLSLNAAVKAELAAGDREIRLLQHSIVLLSTADWARRRWVWFARLTNSRSLWEVWIRAREQHRRQLAAAAATHLRGRAAAKASRMQLPGDVVPAPEPAPTPSIWSAVTGDYGLGVDCTNMSNAETRCALPPRCSPAAMLSCLCISPISCIPRPGSVLTACVLCSGGRWSMQAPGRRSPR